MILLCHFFGCMMRHLDGNIYRYLAYSLNVGVQIFLCISGYLYGSKNIERWFAWFLGRIKKVFIPYLLLVLGVFFVEYVFFSTIHEPGVYVEYLFGLSGIKWAGFPYGWVTSYLAHTWFITAIFLCYIITPILQRFKTQPFISILFLVLVYGGGYLIGIQFVRVILSWIFLYSFCYFYAGLNDETKRTIMLVLVILFVSVLSQLTPFDYYGAFGCNVYQLSHDIGGLFIFICGLYFISNLPKSKLSKPNWFVRTIDSYSFSIYLVHYSVLVGVFRHFANIGVCIGLSIIGIIIITYIFEKTISKLNSFVLKKIK